MMRTKYFIAALALVLMTGVILAPIVRLHPSERVYSVGELVAGVQQQPRTWAGRTVLVRGVERGVQTVSLCAMATPCQQTTWLYLGPIASGGGARGSGRGALVTRPAPQGVVASTTGRPSPPRALPVPVILTLNARSPGLSVLLGAHAPAVRPQRPLPTILYTLPGLGSALRRLFPEETVVTMRVRLTPGGPCAADSPGPCIASILVASQ